MDFESLHHQSSPLLVCNVWDVSSAIIAEQVGYQCLGTSSAAIARMLGYADGEEMAFSELYDLVVKIKRKTSTPLTVDIEAGFGQTAEQIYTNITALAEIGVVGVNIEDSEVIEKTRCLKEPTLMAGIISDLNARLSSSNISMFLNIRTDAYLTKHANPLEETKRRISLYQDAGANGIFVPFLANPQEIKILVNYTPLPLNLICTQELPDFATLTQLGVNRISMGNYAYSNMCKILEQSLLGVKNMQSFAPLFSLTDQ